MVEEIVEFNFAESALESFVRDGCGKNVRRSKPLTICTYCPIIVPVGMHIKKKGRNLNPELESIMDERSKECEVTGKGDYILKIEKKKLVRHAKTICETNLLNRTVKAKICNHCMVRDYMFELLREMYPHRSQAIESSIEEYRSRVK